MLSKELNRTTNKTPLQKKEDSNRGVSLVDNRPQSVLQQKAKQNNTGLPNQLKTGIENLSGHSMDDVKVHYNSTKPAQLNARAYAQGSEIHLGTGQEKHLPHEAWHVVQQKQGRVKPTKQLKAKVNINDDPSLEKEADVMGSKALLTQNVPSKNLIQKRENNVVQRITEDGFGAFYAKNIAELGMYGSEAKVKSIVEKSLGKKLPEITLGDLNEHFGYGEAGPSEDNSPHYMPDRKAATQYADTGYRVQHKPFGRIHVAFSKIDVNSAEATITFTPAPGQLPEGTIVGFLQTVKSPLVESHAAERAVDHPEHETVDRQGRGFKGSPYFGVENEGHTLDNTKLKLGTESKPAIMTDHPSYSGSRYENWNPTFETAAIIISCPVAKLKGSVLAIAHWEILVDSPAYKKTARVGSRESHTNLPSDSFIKAVQIWNGKHYQEDGNDQQRELVDLKVIHH